MVIPKWFQISTTWKFREHTLAPCHTIKQLYSVIPPPNPCVWCFVSLSWKLENQEYFFLTTRNKANYNDPGNIFSDFFLIQFSILMIEENVNVPFQQLTMELWIQVFDMLFDFPGGWKNRIFLPDSPKQDQLWGPKKILNCLLFYSIPDRRAFIFNHM